MFDIFYPYFNKNMKMIDYINCSDTYYNLFYQFIKGEITNENFKIKLKVFFTTDTISISLIEKYVLVMIKKKYNIYLDSINGLELNYNLNIYNEFLRLNNDINYFIDSYIDYYTEIYKHVQISEHPIFLEIDENKKYVLIDGLHRFIMCYNLNIKPKFIVIKSSYTVYNDIIEKLQLDYINMYIKFNNSFILYNPISHFLFDDYNVIRDDRSSIILNYLKDKNLKKGLEIGCHNGYLTITLSKNNYDMTAIEYDINYYKLTNNILTLCDINNINVINCDINNYNFNVNDYDFIIALSVFYHLLIRDSPKFYDLFKNLISKTKYLIFDDEVRTQTLYIDKIKNIIDENNCSLLKIYTGTDDRSIYCVINNNLINN